MNISELIMQRTALKQLLRDMAEQMDQEQIDTLLDRIQILTRIIEDYEANKEK